MAAILDGWSRRVIGYAISRSMDARLAVAALKAAIRARQPPKGCVHHSDRRFHLVIVTPHEALRRPLESAQYASELYRSLLAEHGLIGSMGRRGNPYDNAKAELHEDVEGRSRLSDGLRNLRADLPGPSTRSTTLAGSTPHSAI
jgi:putative transposase